MGFASSSGGNLKNLNAVALGQSSLQPLAAVEGAPVVFDEDHSRLESKLRYKDGEGFLTFDVSLFTVDGNVHTAQRMASSQSFQTGSSPMR